MTVEHNEIYHAGYNQGVVERDLAVGNGGNGPNDGGSTAWFDTAAEFYNLIVGNVVSGSYDNSGYYSDGNGIIVDGLGVDPASVDREQSRLRERWVGIVVYYNKRRYLGGETPPTRASHFLCKRLVSVTVAPVRVNV